MTTVLVAVPAHDEAAEIGESLRSVVTAARRATGDGSCSRVVVGVGLHRCSDGTATEVAAAARETGHEIHAVDDHVSATVGAVRSRLIDTLIRLCDPVPGRTWVFNTDADSHVPADWITRILTGVAGTGATAVAGMTELRGWTGSASALLAYQDILSAGIDGDAHSHVYGANLAVRLDAYTRVGGFRALNGEDHDLVNRLREAGEPVVTRADSFVGTSSRMTGRAPDGLAALLQRLTSAARITDQHPYQSRRPVMATVTRLIDTTPQRVWDVLSDGWLFPVWVVGASRMRDVDDAWPAPGSTLHHSVGSWPALIDDETTVHACDPLSRLELRARARPGGTAAVVLTLEAAGAGTRVALEEDAISGPGVLVPKPVRSMGLTWRNTETLRRLAYIAERRPTQA